MGNNGRVAAIQMVSGQDLEKNLRTTEKLCAEAVASGAQVVVLPENFALLDSKAVVSLGQEEAKSRRLQCFLANLAKEHGIWVVGGSIPVADTGVDGRVYSSCFVFDNAGGMQARYNKIHLFDVDVGDSTGSYRESDRFYSGSQPVVVDTPIGKLGLAICYDLRFPELFSQLRSMGAEWFVLPSAFTYTTGQAHWNTLVRARAIEGQCYMVAVNQGGEHSPTRRTWGHSMIVDPWGKVITSIEEGEGVVVAEIDRGYISELRTKMPIQSHRRIGK